MLWPTIEKLRAIKKDEFLSTQERTQQIAELLTKPTVLQGLPFELGSYNADTKAFSMTINVLGKHTAQIPMPTEEARDFKQDIGQFTLQVEVKVTPDEEIVCVGGELENPTSGKKYSLSQQSFATVAQTQGNGPVIEIIEPAGTTRGISIVAKGHQTKVVGIAKDASGVAYVQVNGQKASLNPVSGGVRFSAEVILGMGDNYINVEAMNTNQDKSFKNFVIKRGDAASAEVTKPGPSTKPSLWCLAIGVSNYKNPKLNLKYADYDATQLAAAFKSQSGKLFGEVHTKTLINAEATRNNILKAMGDFLGQACADDVALVFVAGHGIKHKQTGSYYFVTHETDPANLISSGLRWSDFEEGMTIIKSNVSKVILMLDTCHAGAMQVSMRDLEAGEDLAEMLKEAEGTYVLSSSKGSEASEEGEHLRLPGEPAGKGHGAFTYAILKGLAGEADLTRDNNITIFELNAYVGKLVPQITKGKQHPYPKTAGTDMPIYLTK